MDKLKEIKTFKRIRREKLGKEPAFQTGENNFEKSDDKEINADGVTIHPSFQYHIPAPYSMYKIFCDPVHGHISLHPASVAIIDTPEFQRLRDLKQTGLVEYVYPGATHNRFGHSLGVAFLAGKFLQHLREKQPELGITDVDVLCVEIAGLCHDLGHGPLSHTWELVMQEANRQKKVKESWKHEKVSQNMLDYLVMKNSLIPELQKYGIGPAQMQIIKDLIEGAQPEDTEKLFMFQIVNNAQSGLDVDKWDYFLRDCYYLGLRSNFEHERLVQFSKVLVVDGRKQICFRDKVLEGVYNMFRTRSNLHRLAYQHRVVKILEIMFIDAILKANEKVSSPSGEQLFFWEWSMDAAFGHGEHLHEALEKFCTLTDSLVFSSLKHCSDPTLSAIILAIEKRSFKCSSLYKQVALKISPFFVAHSFIKEVMAKYLPSVNREVIEEYGTTMKNPVIHVCMDDVAICVTSINWGKKHKNPVEFVHFYAKDSPLNPHALNHEECSVILPKAFEEIQVLIICKRSDSFAFEVIKLCFERAWQRILKFSHL